MSIATKLRLIAGALDRLLPAGHSVELNIRRYAGDISIQVHGVKSYAEAQEFMRSLGIGKRNKSVWSDELSGPQGRTVLKGELAEGIDVTMYCSGLPPSCRLETVKERVPKTQTVEVGEFVEIERTKVVCGNGEGA